MLDRSGILRQEMEYNQEIQSAINRVFALDYRNELHDAASRIGK